MIKRSEHINDFRVENIQFVITQDVDLDTGGITLGANSTLDFEGGKFISSTGVSRSVNGTKTRILNKQKTNNALGSNVKLAGTWYNFGTLVDAPTDAKVIGLEYFSTDINKNLWWNGTKWVESDGATAGVSRSGTFANKPASSDIYVGFQYFNTDSHKMITWDGAKWYNPDGTEAVS